MKIKKQAWCVLWTDGATGDIKIDNADAHVFNECPSIEPTFALAIYEKKKDAPDLSGNYKKEYTLVKCEIIYEVPAKNNSRKKK